MPDQDLVSAFATFADASAAFWLNRCPATAKALLAAAERLDVFDRSDLSFWPSDGIRHTTLMQMGDEGREFAGIGPDDNW